ncbi:hypothetical protein KI387_020146, partial [Taxus chinensis]
GCGSLMGQARACSSPSLGADVSSTSSGLVHHMVQPKYVSRPAENYPGWTIWRTELGLILTPKACVLRPEGCILYVFIYYYEENIDGW